MPACLHRSMHVRLPPTPVYCLDIRSKPSKLPNTLVSTLHAQHLHSFIHQYIPKLNSAIAMKALHLVVLVCYSSSRVWGHVGDSISSGEALSTLFGRDTVTTKDGRCGIVSNGNGLGMHCSTKSKKCCSYLGYCGDSDSHCGKCPATSTTLEASCALLTR